MLRIGEWRMGGSRSRPPTSRSWSRTSRRSRTTSCARRPPTYASGWRTASRSTSLLFEAYAAVREARWRESQQRMFDVQMMGGIVLHEGDIAEMKTGEGKTFVASLALYLNALPGTGVHLVTVNDYLAKRDAEWNRPVYERLGMTVGFIQNMMPFAERREAYGADITYGTNSEFGFDYLRDNMAVTKEGLVQRSHSFAIVDEAGLDPDRRGADAADHLGRARERRHHLLRLRPDREGTDAAPATRKGQKGEDETGLSGADYLYDEKHKVVSLRSRRSRRSSARSRSRTCTTRATSSSSTT